jgi:hypothetical protein
MNKWQSAPSNLNSVVLSMTSIFSTFYFEIWGSHGSEDVCAGLLGCDSMLVGTKVSEEYWYTATSLLGYHSSEGHSGQILF